MIGHLGQTSQTQMATPLPESFIDGRLLEAGSHIAQKTGVREIRAACDGSAVTLAVQATMANTLWACHAGGETVEASPLRASRRAFARQRGW